MKTRRAAAALALAVAGLARPVQAQPAAKPDYKLLVAHRNDGTVAATKSMAL